MKLTQQQIFGLVEDHLVDVCKGHKLVKDAANQFTLMQQAAHDEGYDLQLCSSFRSFERQLQIWNGKWEGKRPLYDLQNNEINNSTLSPTERIHAIMLWSALPGASRHHWGTDLDYYDKAAVDTWEGDFSLIPEEYEASGPCAGLSCWINENAEHFGFVFPYKDYVGGVAREPWHLSYAPVAESIIDAISLDGLKDVLYNSDLHGKDAVIEQLDGLFTRYTLNKGTQL